MVPHLWIVQNYRHSVRYEVQIIQRVHGTRVCCPSTKQKIFSREKITQLWISFEKIQFNKMINYYNSKSYSQNNFTKKKSELFSISTKVEHLFGAPAPRKYQPKFPNLIGMGWFISFFVLISSQNDSHQKRFYIQAASLVLIKIA